MAEPGMLGSATNRTHPSSLTTQDVGTMDSADEGRGLEESPDKTVALSSGEGVNPQEASSPPTLLASTTEATQEAEELTSDVRRRIDGENDEVVHGKETSGRKHRNESVEAKNMRRSSSKVNRKIRKRGRHVWLVNVEDNAVAPRYSWLPPYQYETDLQRRAIRKREISERPKPPLSSPETPESDDSQKSLHTSSSVNSETDHPAGTFVDQETKDLLEQYGDVALGMKLTIVGGKVIVEGLNALSDGRASPAQLTGLIRRGDVLLSVDNVSLVNMPLNQLVEGLKPLSTPLDGNSYQRTLHLRFAAGQGLALLNKREAQLKTTTAAGDSASDMFSLSNFMPRDVPMVDNLSGLPILQNVDGVATKKGGEKVVKQPVVATAKPTAPIDQNAQKESPTGFSQMALRVARNRDWERKKLTSYFFLSEENYSELLRPTVVSFDSNEGNYEIVVSQSEMLAQGEHAMKGAKVLFYNMEDLDKGTDIRSFHKWNSQISLRSRASSRRKYLLETRSLAESNKGDGSSSVASAGSSVSEDLDGIDGDDMLLGLAAHDEIWRRQVVETLQQAAEELDADGKAKTDEAAASKEPVAKNLDTAMSIELGSLLFGAQMSRIITKKKRPLALPPAEVTSVLFDLTTNLASIMPDEILSQSGIHGPAQSNLTSFVKAKQSHLDENVSLASQFVVKEALPAWLESFRPLPREQRRLLWPQSRTVVGDSHTISSYSQAFSEDSLTLDSESTGNPPHAQRSKNLQEQIEDMELDVETRAETCYLVTVYLTQVLLPKLEGAASSYGDKSTLEEDAIDFVEKFGAYLKLDTCLVCAALVQADRVIASLLKVARYDLCHQDAMKKLSKTTGLLLYEPALLSAILKRLRGVRADQKSVEQIRSLLAVCVSAFPDLRPWQVRSALIPRTKEAVDEGTESKTPNEQVYNDLYYHYLSMLMHPLEGHDLARCNSTLVKEWCEMSVIPTTDVDTDAGDSVEIATSETRRKNFVAVASNASSDHQLYSRDLVFLLELSMTAGELDLALDLASEIMNDRTPTTNHQLLFQVLPHLRAIARTSVNVGSSLAPQDIDVPRLQRTLHLFHTMAMKTRASPKPIVFADELYALLLASQRCGDAEEPSGAEMELIDLLSDNADPRQVLPMLALWTRSHSLPSYALAYIRKSLLRGVKSGLRSELSGSLLRIKDARRREGLSEESVYISSHESLRQDQDSSQGNNIWNKMYAGDAAIEK